MSKLFYCKYCKTPIISVPLNIAFLAFWLPVLNIAYAKNSRSDDVILFIKQWSVFVLVQWILQSILRELYFQY